MALTVYPEEGFNSWISLENAEAYLSTRLNSEAWFNLGDDSDQEAALLTAFRSLSELSLDLRILESSDTSGKADALRALSQAQCEQALHELTRNLDAQQALAASLGGLLSVRFQEQKKSDRYSQRALLFLRPWRSLRFIKRMR